jgi:hypothetical protein
MRAGERTLATFKEGQIMVKRIIGAACGALVVGLCLAATAGATGTVNRTTYLTFSGDVALPGVKLAAGTYIFELPEPMTSPSLVRVLSKDRKTTHLLAFTHFVNRPSGSNRNKPVSLGEARRGEAVPIAAWYPTDESMGREFIYR